MATANYELPWGKNLTGIAHGFLSAWQVNATAYLQSGVAYTVINATSRTNTGLRHADRRRPADRERRSESSRERADHPALVRHDVFSAAAPFTSGNVGLSLDARAGTETD